MTKLEQIQSPLQDPPIKTGGELAKSSRITMEQLNIKPAVVFEMGSQGSWYNRDDS